MSGPATRTRRAPRVATVTARGEPLLWLTGGALVLCLVMITGLLGWIGWHGMRSFWPGPLVQVETVDGRAFLGEEAGEEEYVPGDTGFAALPDAARGAASAAFEADGVLARRQLRTGNFRLFGTHFEWIGVPEIAREHRPEWAIVVERREWGRFYGFPATSARRTPVGDGIDWRQLAAAAVPEADGEIAVEVERRVAGRAVPRFVAPGDVGDGDRVVAIAEVWRGAERAWQRFVARHDTVADLRARAVHLRETEIGRVSDRLEDARLRLREAELELEPTPAWTAAHARLREARRTGDAAAVAAAEARLGDVEADVGRPAPGFLDVVAEVEAVEREAQAEFDRISREIERIEAEAGRDVLHVTTVREGHEAVLALADVVRAYPANQLDAFGRLGVYADRWAEYLTAEPREANTEGGIFPAIFGTVLMTLVMCIAVVPFGVLAALYLREYARAGPVTTAVRVAVNNLAGVPSIVFGVFGLGFFCYIVGASIDELWFEARLPQPTFGKGGLLWASLTLALMTAPVVIVATEEALAAVPNSMREGSYACGASKWQTIRRIVLPRALPGILTGAILAMARGAGEVAPLMLVGAVKLAPELPIDAAPPFGADRSFMHLGFHVYDLGFQSQNSAAARPMVYTTALLLIAIVAILNVTAIRLRGRLRRRFVSSAF